MVTISEKYTTDDVLMPGPSGANIGASGINDITKQINVNTSGISANATNLTNLKENMMVLMYSGRGTVQELNEATVDSFTFTAGDFADTDTIWVWAFAPSSTQNIVFKVRIEDGTNTLDSDVPAGQSRQCLDLKFFQNTAGANTQLIGVQRAIDVTGETERISLITGTMIANWITTAFSIKLRMDTDDTVREYFWFIYKIKGD